MLALQPASRQMRRRWGQTYCAGENHMPSHQGKRATVPCSSQNGLLQLCHKPIALQSSPMHLCVSTAIRLWMVQSIHNLIQPQFVDQYNVLSSVNAKSNDTMRCMYPRHFAHSWALLQGMQKGRLPHVCQMGVPKLPCQMCWGQHMNSYFSKLAPPRSVDCHIVHALKCSNEDDIG